METIRSEISDGDTVVTPETITTYTRDAAGRVLQTRRDRGAMTTTESVEYDKLGRIVRQTDVLGRVTATAYSENGLTETVTKAAEVNPPRPPPAPPSSPNVTPTAPYSMNTARDSANATMSMTSAITA